MTRSNPYNNNRTKKQKYESCVKQVKKQEGYNPYAVCRSSVYGKQKNKSVNTYNK